MTHAERALLLAVAKTLTSIAPVNRRLKAAIAAVEAEAAPKEDILARVWNDETKAWDDQPKPAVCPTCKGIGELPWAKSPCGNEMYKCHDCNGSGKKEK